jgi:hypothetical protein
MFYFLWVYVFRVRLKLIMFLVALFATLHFIGEVSK